MLTEGRLLGSYAKLVGSAISRRDFGFVAAGTGAIVVRVFQNLAHVVRNTNRVTCEFCGWQGRGFFAGVFPGYARYGVMCPRCHSLDRHRLILRYLHERTDVFRGTRPMRVLHVAPETGLRNLLSTYPMLEYVSADLDSKMADVRTDLTALAFKAEAFDLILCSHVLEHIREDFLAMEELFRVLAKGGTAILQVPLDSSLEHTTEKPVADESGHVREYGRDYVDRLEQAGFTVTVESYADGHGEFEAERYGLSGEDLYTVSKPN